MVGPAFGAAKADRLSEISNILAGSRTTTSTHLMPSRRKFEHLAVDIQAAVAVAPFNLLCFGDPASERDDCLAQGMSTVGERVGVGVVAQKQSGDHAGRFEFA